MLKVVSYNILDGGLGRLDPIYETLLYLGGDVVGLCEADDERGVRYLAEKLGMDYVTAAGIGSPPRGVALLSRWPIERMVNLAAREPLLDRGAIEAVVEVEGEPIRVVAVHLAAGQERSDEEKRLAQIDRVLAALEGERMPTVLMGDLNAAAPYEPFDFDAASPKVRQRLADRGRREPDYDVVERIVRGGWIDAYHRARPHEPKHTYTTGFPAARFDYIWLSSDLTHRLADADVERGGFAPYCSDHYPVWASLRFKK